MTIRRRFVSGFALLVGVAAFGAVHAGDAASEIKKAARKVGTEIAHESKKVGHAVADTSKEVGQATAREAKTAWFKTRAWTTEKSKRVADATVRWWDDVIRSKEEERDRLRKENESLKR